MEGTFVLRLQLRQMSSEVTNLVSVVISCYNHENYLSDAIESVLHQTYPHYEVVVVDDGSIDGSWQVAQSFAGVRCIKQQNMGTPAATRNRGLREIQGEYVVLLDGDDRLLPDALEVGLRHLRQHPDCAFVAGRCQAISNRRCLTALTPPNESDHYHALLLRNYILTPGCVVFRSDVVKELGGFNESPEIKGSDDYEIYLRIAARWPVWYHEEIVLEYREHGSNLSKNPERMLKSTLTVLRDQYDIAKTKEAYRRAYNRGIANSRRYFGGQVLEKVRDHVRARAWKEAFREIELLIRICPQLALKHALRKAYCVLFRVKSDRVQPE